MPSFLTSPQSRESVVVSAFTMDDVERLTGITTHQLRRWYRIGFFHPLYGEENRRVPYSRIYSFKDVASLRVLSQLLNFGVSPQHLREVSGKLRHLQDDRWLKVDLYVVKKKVVFFDPETGGPREIVSGQWQ